MREKIKSAIQSIHDKIKTGEGIKVIIRYGAVALLLVILGCASYAYRQRLAAPDDTVLPKAAVAMRVPESLPAPAPEPVKWVWPLEGEIVGAYSPDAPVWSGTLGQWQTHPALDISGSPGEAVYACRDGEVVDAWNDRLWGNVIVIAHDDAYQSTYAGLNTLKLVNPGDMVKAGDVISAVGDSASCEAELSYHLHFELTQDGTPDDFTALISASE